jgi:hypothetical protein
MIDGLTRIPVLLLPLSVLWSQAPVSRTATDLATSNSAAAANTIQTQAFPRIIAGRDWETTFVLVNPGATPINFHLYLLATDGTPQALTLRNPSDGTVQTTSDVAGTLAPNSSLNLILTDSAAPAREGWSVLSYDSSQGKLGGYAILRHRGLGGFNFETSVPLNSLQDFSLCLPFDNTQGYRTQVTLIDPASNMPAQVNLTYRATGGQLLLLDSVSLQPGQQMTISLPDLYPDLANQAGNIAIEANINRLSVLGLRYNEMYGAIASIPGIN